MKNRWFTLIEILIVIVIMSILLALSLGISSGRVQILKEKYAQEQFISTYNTLFSRNFLTNYYGEQIYDNLIINMEEMKPGFSYSYNNAENISIYSGKTEIDWNLVVKDLSWFDSNFVDIVFKPYEFWCLLSGWNKTWDILDVTLYVDNKKDYCYRVNANLCRLEKIVCPGEQN